MGFLRDWWEKRKENKAKVQAIGEQGREQIKVEKQRFKMQKPLLKAQTKWEVKQTKQKTKLERGRWWVKWLIGFLIVIGVLYWYLFSFTDYGDDFILTVKQKNIFGETSEELEEGGIMHQFRIIEKVLTGEFDPEELWTSEEVQSEYAVPEEFELFVTDVKPLKEKFRDGEDIVVIGRINLISGFDKTTTVTLGVEPDKLCVDDDTCTSGDWTCYISGSDTENIFQMEKIYNRQFNCEHAGFAEPNDVNDEEVITDVRVTWEYSTSAVAGKQVYAFNSDVLDKEKDVLEKYDISDDSLASWYIGDENVNLGLGLSQTEEVRARREEDLFKSENYLAISIENTGSGKVVELESLSVSFPNNGNILVADQIAEGDDSDIIFDGPSTEVITIREVDVTTKKFSLSNKERTTKFRDIEPAEHTTYYIPFVVADDYVGDSDFRSFLVKADIRYKYKEYDSLAITVDK